MSNSPLWQAHKAAGALFAPHQGRLAPRRYGPVSIEYQRLTTDAGLSDRSYVGRLRVMGKDALDLLNRLSTNDLMGLVPGSGGATILTTNKGRIIDRLVVLHMNDSVLLLTSPRTRTEVARWIDTYTFLEDARVEDATEGTAVLSVSGPNSALRLDTLMGGNLEGLPLYHWRALSVAGMPVTAVHTDPVGLPGYDLIASTEHAPRLWEHLRDSGIPPVGHAALEMVRVERGVPLQGRELTQEFNPLEAEQWDAVSFAKGCYVGQEVVARLSTYDKVQKHLVLLKVDGRGAVPPGAVVQADGQRVGSVTSAACPPRRHKTLALAYLHRSHARPGVAVEVVVDGAYRPARAARLPGGRKNHA